MAETFRYTLVKPARALYSNIAVKSAPRGVANAVAKFSATFGVEKEDMDNMIPLMVQAIQSECGAFTKPTDYYLAAMSGTTAATRTIQKGEFDSQGKTEAEAFKIMEKANARAELYRPYAGILSAASQFAIALAKLGAGGKIEDIPDEEHARATAAKDLFYPGAFIVPAVAFKGYRPKTVDAKGGCTAYLQNCLFIRKGERIAGAGGPGNNEVFGAYAGYSDVDPTALTPGSGGVAEPESVADQF